MSTPHDIRDHQSWLGYLQPDGLVVSPAALIDSGIYFDRNLRPQQQRFLDHLSDHQGWQEGDDARLINLPAFLTDFLEWRDDDLVSDDDIPDSLRVFIEGYRETLFPTHAVKSPDHPETYQLLILETSAEDLDKPTAENERGWHVSPAKRFERLLRESGVPIGLLSNGSHLRLIYAPAGENPGSITFPVSAMAEIAGRPVLGGFCMLLDAYRLFTAPEKETLPAILQKSRDFQANVSTELASQVLDGLYELLRGLQSANFKSDGKLLADTLARRPDAIYEAQLNVLMRLVFLLFAEDRGLMPDSSLYQQHYSVHALYDQLRQDHEKFPDTMDQRFGAWARLLSVFRLVYDGSRHKQMSLPARFGYLFDPTRFPFLEGRDENGELTEQGLPRIPDATIHIVLSKLLYLKGEKLSYRTLDVEQIGSVYETMMGFRLQVADGPTIAIKPKKKTGAPTNINLEALLATPGKDRKKWFKERTDRDLPTKTNTALKAAESQDEALAALEKIIALNATPQKVQAGALLLQPSDERRKSGSHYTPRKLTEPIVRKALEPILANLSDKDSGTGPLPSDILALKICDPAVGSGAFLVEACRQLANALVAAWAEHGGKPFIPADEDELLHARRLVAQRCLYGVDRNPMAADLCKLSLWLATLAKDHPFTFLDHSIRHGDSLVGLSKKQILHFHWDLSHQSAEQLTIGQDKVVKRLDRALKYRKNILEAGDSMLPTMKADQLKRADDALDYARRIGDLTLAAFFNADKAKARQELRDQYLDLLTTAETEANVETMLGATGEIRKIIATLKAGEHTFAPFHWEIEFPEVFERSNPGFDCFVGNPPYGGHVLTTSNNLLYYTDYLRERFVESGGKCDLVAFFFRNTFALLRTSGSLGLVATKTIAQGDTRSSGLGWISVNGGCIYAAKKRLRWPGAAAVVVSVIHISKERKFTRCELGNRQVNQITSYLFHQGGNEDPKVITHDGIQTFQGSVIRGKGFLFQDGPEEASSLLQMDQILRMNPKNGERIKMFLGGEDLNNSPNQRSSRYVIDFEEMTYQEASRWPELLEIVRKKVLPARQASKAKSSSGTVLEYWWRFGHTARELYDAIRPLDRVLAIAQTSNTLGFSFVPKDCVLAQTLVVFNTDDFAVFAVLQSRTHQVWALFFAATMKDDARYIPTDCFHTFPLPPEWGLKPNLSNIGTNYHKFRAKIMVDNDEGLTKTYNRFHDPEESSPEIHRLRELHAEMDRAVLDAYGWTDIPTDCEFIPDYYEEDKDGNEVPKSIRYRWLDEVRDEVLARLLALNAERYQQEVNAGLHAKKSAKKKTTRKRTTKKAAKKKEEKNVRSDQDDNQTTLGI